MDNHWVEYIVNDSITVGKQQILGGENVDLKIWKNANIWITRYFFLNCKHLYKAEKMQIG